MIGMITSPQKVCYQKLKPLQHETQYEGTKSSEDLRNVSKKKTSTVLLHSHFCRNFSHEGNVMRNLAEMCELLTVPQSALKSSPKESVSKSAHAVSLVVLHRHYLVSVFRKSMQGLGWEERGANVISRYVAIWHEMYQMCVPFAVEWSCVWYWYSY